MTQVDPRLYPIPRDLQKDPEVRKYFEDLERFLHDLWFRTGGGDDEIASVSIRESFAWDTNTDDTGINGVKVSQLYPSEQKIERQFLYQVEKSEKEFRAVAPISDYAALDHDFINATGNITIFFPEYPCVNTTFTVRNGDGSTIKLDGNGRMMNTESSGTMVTKGTSIDFYYFIESNEWFAK